MTELWQQIAEANETISTTGIEKKNKDGSKSVKQYAEVNQRVKAFRMVYPSGNIDTEIVTWSDDGNIVIKATAYDNDGRKLANGFANEKVGSSFINSTSALENAETSAIGRCLGFCGFGIETSICSYEEVTNAKMNQSSEPKAEKPIDKHDIKGSMSNEQMGVMTDLCTPEILEKYLNHMGVECLDDLTFNQAQAIINTRMKGDKNGGQ